MSLMLWLWQRFRQYVRRLLGVAATFDIQRSVFDKVPDPMPSGGDMLGLTVELGVPCHSNGAVIITFDKCRFCLFFP